MRKRISGIYRSCQCSENEKDKLVVLASCGDSKAQSKIINCCTSIIYSLAHLRAKNQDDFDDLVQDGMIGLLNAIRYFVPGKGCSFTTYAFCAIKTSMSKKYAPYKTVSIEDITENNMDICEFRQPFLTEEAAVSRLTIDEILSKINTVLSSKERLVVRLKCGLETGKGKSFVQISGIMGLSEYSARRLYVKALNKLKQPVRQKHE